MKKLLALLLIASQAYAGLPPTTSKVSGDAANVTTFNFQAPNFTGTHTGTTLSLGVNGIAGGGTGQTTASAAFNALSPVTSTGDLIVGNGANSSTRLAIGTAGKLLTSNGTTAVWASNGSLIPPTVQTFLSGSGTYYPSYIFFVTAANATAGATYTNNTVTFTVSQTISAGTILVATATGAPTASGTLTKATGTGDATITFSSYTNTPLAIEVTMVGGGGGGGGSGSAGGSGGAGGTTSFGTSLLTATGGTVGAPTGNSGPAAAGSCGSIVFCNALPGGSPGQAYNNNNGGFAGGVGGASAFGGAGVGGVPNGNGGAGAANTGGGGGGGGSQTNTINIGSGGGSGAFTWATINPVSASYAYSVGAAGTAGSAGTGGATSGGAGALGIIRVVEKWQ